MFLLIPVLLAAVACTSVGPSDSAAGPPAAECLEGLPVPQETPAPPGEAQPDAPEAPHLCRGPCLPLHTIEGMSGHFSVPSACLANPAPPGEILGHPSAGYIHVNLGNGKHLEAFSVTEVLWDRVELGYALNYLDVGDVYEDIGNATGVRPSGHAVRLHTLNGRLQLLKDGEFDQSWLPAVTAGVHGKWNEDFDGLDRDLAPLGGLDGIAGIDHEAGVEFTLFASKMLTCLPRPVMLTAGVRNTDAAHVGLLGFTRHRKTLFEAAACCLLTDRIVLAAEYRRKRSEYDETHGLLDREDDWFVLAAAFLVSDRCSVAAGYGHFGHVLNHTANRSWGVAVKYEF